MLKPEGDLRHRVHESELLWVLESRSESGKISHAEIVDSIERIVYEREGKQGLYVRYRGVWRPLHSVSEFRELVKLSNAGNVYLFSNEWGVSSGNRGSIKKLSPASFIYTHEHGFS